MIFKNIYIKKSRQNLIQIYTKMHHIASLKKNYWVSMPQYNLAKSTASPCKFPNQKKMPPPPLPNFSHASLCLLIAVAHTCSAHN